MPCAIDEVDWTADGQMVSIAHPTKAEKTQPSTNVAPYAKVSATFTETPAWKGSVNDGRVLQTAVVPPNHWTNYRSIPQSQSGDSLVYQWDGTVRVNSSKVWFDVDSNARARRLVEDSVLGRGPAHGRMSPTRVHIQRPQARPTPTPSPSMR